MTPSRGLAILLASLAVSSCSGPRLRTVTPPPQRTRAATPTPVPPAPGPAVSPAPTAPEPSPPATVPRTPLSPLGEPGLSPFATAPPAGAPAAAAPARPAGRSGRQIVLNFDNADIEAVIQAASEIVGFNYTIGPGVQGKKVTVQTSGRIPEDEVLNVLLAILEVHGVTAIRSDNLYKIVPLASARERPVPTIIGIQPDPGRKGDEVITQIVPISYVSADRLAATLRAFVQGGNVLVQGNLLIATDTAANIARLLQIVAVLDVEGALDELRIIAVRYADAVELAKTLNDFFTGRRVRTPTPTITPAPPVPPRPGVPAAPAPATAPEAPERPPFILADKRTNALIVSARRGDLETLTRLLGQLDLDTQANKRVFVYYVENVKAKELAATLSEIFGRPSDAPGTRPPERRDAPGPGAPTYLGPSLQPPPATPAPTAAGPTAASVEGEPGVVEGQVKVVADEPNNALVVTTFPRNWPLIEDTIRKLDRTPKQVLIEVLVVEVALNDENRLGLEWTLRTQRDVTVGGQKYNVGNVSRLDVGLPSTLGTPAIPTGPSGFLPVLVPPTAGLSLFLFETDRFFGLLNLYANYGQLNVLSSPHILTSENKKAVINVSNSVPIVTQQVVSQTGTTTTQPQQAPTNVLTQNVEYRDAGIVLTVTPRISDRRVVSLDVKQTVNDVGDPRPPSGSPDIIKREAETSVVLFDNQTLVLGGLIRTRNASTRQGIPGLSRIPIVGFLFGSDVETTQRTELLILITPRVIGDPGDALDLYRQIRAQRPGLERGLRDHPTILKPEGEVLPTPVAPPPAPPPPAGVPYAPSER